MCILSQFSRSRPRVCVPVIHNGTAPRRSLEGQGQPTRNVEASVSPRLLPLQNLVWGLGSHMPNFTLGGGKCFSEVFQCPGFKDRVALQVQAVIPENHSRLHLCTQRQVVATCIWGGHGRGLAAVSTLCLSSPSVTEDRAQSWTA